MKLTVVGGGSTYTPELIDGFARLRDTLPITELVLVDPAAERLELVGGLARRIFAKQDHAGKVVTTSDLDAGVEGADAVLLQLRVGGQAAREQDETWPLECGCVGQETTGAGGLAKALRTVPVVLDIAERVRRANPDAWIIDFTNPVGIVTRALLQAGHKAVGLCNVAIGFQRKFAALLDVAPSEVHLDHVGLNHLTWERAEVAAMEKELLEMYGDPALDEKPALLAKRGGAYYSEAAVDLAAALLGGGGSPYQVVNTYNNGTLPFLPDDAVIETQAAVGAHGAAPLPVAPVDPLYAGLIANVTAYEDLALEAALRGGRDRVFKALLAHPLVGQYAYADGLTDRLIAHNREHLAWA